MKLSTIIKLRKELESIKESGLTISEYCTKIGKARSGYSIRIKKVIESEGEYKEEAEKVISLYNELSGKRKPKSKFQEADLFSLDGSVSEKVIEENTEPDEFDGTTHVTYIRSLSTNKITGYEVQVKVRDKADFITTLSRSDAELIFGLYTYYGGNITARNVANEFPRYTLPEVKKIFRAFKLTKDSAWFPPHICEEYTEEEKAQYRMNLKERAAFKYADSRQERDFKNTINKMASEINRLKNFNGQFEEILTKFTGKNSTIIKHFPKVISDGKTIMIFLADMHIGAKVNDQALFDNHYDMSVVYSRMDQIIAYFSKFSPCKRIVVVNVGDALDGMDNQTARRDHFIPQNMNNFEQLNNYVGAIKYLFDNMIANGMASEYSYISVPCGNHDGAFGYAAAQLAAATLKLNYPQIETYVESKFYVRYDVGEYSYLICHGKDEQFMRNGFKINLDDNTELKINQYIDSLDGLKPNVNVVSGDLHNEAMSRGKKFKYWKVGSFFGSSEYCMYGWGNTPAHVNYHIISDDILMNGTVELK